MREDCCGQFVTSPFKFLVCLITCHAYSIDLVHIIVLIDLKWDQPINKKLWQTQINQSTTSHDKWQILAADEVGHSANGHPTCFLNEGDRLTEIGVRVLYCIVEKQLRNLEILKPLLRLTTWPLLDPASDLALTPTLLTSQSVNRLSYSLRFLEKGTLELETDATSFYSQTEVQLSIIIIKEAKTVTEFYRGKIPSINEIGNFKGSPTF
jgi:hypothetical protein